MHLPDSLETSPHDRHPLAAAVRAIGRGPGRGRPLSEAEAEAVVSAILAGDAAPEQVGALLMLWRFRGEGPAETAGMVRAVRRHHGLPRAAGVELDWPSYADGALRTPPWFLAAAKLVALAGVRTALHGPLVGEGRHTIAPTLAALGIAISATPSATLTFCPTAAVMPGLDALLALRGVLGLRSPLNTVARLVNPFAAPVSIDGVFHPPYIDLHLGAARHLGLHRLGVLKGGGGEAMRTALKPVQLFVSDHGVVSDAVWPALTPGITGHALGLDDPGGWIASVWRGEQEDARGAATAIGTAAMALFLTGRAASPGAADAVATELWQSRPRDPTQWPAAPCH
ncbi:MAG: glycosyl transferase family 3 [Alphaproteobacteria bacterium]|nr:glycosyl transferase family 3 [Alphaproteobacteria bacterium]TAD88484.1 MAG: glycosyl transferase family 3 [Alphaproteobacteria bacterium]